MTSKRRGPPQWKWPKNQDQLQNEDALTNEDDLKKWGRPQKWRGPEKCVSCVCQNVTVQCS